MSYQFNNEVLNAILLDLGGTTTYPQDIDALNAILLQLGGTGGHHYMIDAYNELCTIQSVSSNHYYLIDALNAINIGGGGTDERFELPALVQLGAKVNYEPEIKTYIEGLVTPLSSGQLIKLNTLVKSLKSGLGITDLSDAFDALYVLGGETVESSLKNLAKDAHHATSPTPPTFTAYEGFQGNGSSQYIDTGYIPATHGIALQLNSASIGVYSRINNAINSFEFGLIDGNNSLHLAYGVGGTSYNAVNNVVGSGVAVGINPTTGLFISNRIDNSFLRTYIDSNLHSEAAPVVSGGLSTKKVYLLAINNDAPWYSSKQLCFSFIGRGLTRSDIIKLTVAFESYLESNNKQLTIKDANTVWEGDSRTWGLNLPMVTVANIPTKNYSVINNAVSGGNLEMMIERGDFVDSLLKLDRPNILNVWCGYNINDGVATPEGKYALLVSYCNARKSAGWKVNVCTEIDGNGYASWSTDYLALNILIRNDHSFADSMTDLGANVNLQDATNTTYFNIDQVHPNATGNALIASLIAPNILALT